MCRNTFCHIITQKVFFRAPITICNCLPFCLLLDRLSPPLKHKPCQGRHLTPRSLSGTWPVHNGKLRDLGVMPEDPPNEPSYRKGSREPERGRASPSSGVRCVPSLPPLLQTPDSDYLWKEAVGSWGPRLCPHSHSHRGSPEPGSGVPGVAAGLGHCPRP